MPRKRPRTTSTTLLDALRDEKQTQAWEAFFDKYAPVIRSFVRGIVPVTEIDDVVQDTLLTFVKAYRKGAYDRSRGSFRSWLYTVAKRKALELQRKHSRRATHKYRAHGATDYDPVKDAADPRRSDLEVRWEQEWADHLLDSVQRQLCLEFEPDSLRVFDLCVLQHHSTGDVAQLLGKTSGAVATTKLRTKRRFLELARAFACSDDVASDVRRALKRRSHCDRLGG